MSHDHDIAPISQIEDYEASTTTLELNSLQLDPGELTANISEIELGDMRLRHFSVSRALFEELWVAAGWTTFALPLCDASRVRWCGAEVPPQLMGILRSGREHSIVTPAGWECIEIDVRDEVLDEEGIVPGKLFTQALDPRKARLSLTASVYGALRARLQGALRIAVAQERRGNTAAAELESHGTNAQPLRQILLESIATAIDHSQAGRHSTQRNGHFGGGDRYRRVRRACAHIDARIVDNPSITSVAGQFGVDTRTLQRAFLAVVGVTPKQYFLARKLDLAKRELQRLGWLTTVTDVAHRFGFCSSSRFSEQFRRHFGHAPKSASRILATGGTRERLGAKPPPDSRKTRGMVLQVPTECDRRSCDDDGRAVPVQTDRDHDN